MSRIFPELTEAVDNCRICANHFAHDPKPIFQLNPKAKILIAGQAPGRKAHESGIPFNDPSGDRLRAWMGVTREQFYDADRIAILPMGFCYPGQGPSGDLPPRRECARTWRQQLLNTMPNIQLTLVIGSYAMEWHLGKLREANLTETVRAWRAYGPEIIPLPHPSPRNYRWLHNNTWFESEVLPVVRARVNGCLA